MTEHVDALSPAGVSELATFVIRPPRAHYSRHDLGDPLFSIDGVHARRDDITLTNARGLTLHCSHFRMCRASAPTTPLTNLPTVIYLHGNGSCRVESTVLLPLTIPHGISLFALDLSGSGRSGGEFISLGVWERHDVSTAVSHLHNNGVQSIILWGHSMGASTALMYAGLREKLGDQLIHGLVLDSPFASFDKLAQSIVKDMPLPIGVPKKLVLTVGVRAIRKLVRERAGFDVHHIDALTAAKQVVANLPALFIHGTKDAVVPHSHGELLFQHYKSKQKDWLPLAGLEHDTPRPESALDRAFDFILSALYYNSQSQYVKQHQQYRKSTPTTTPTPGKDVVMRTLNSLKQRGNTALTTGRFQDAVFLYTRALHRLIECPGLGPLTSIASTNASLVSSSGVTMSQPNSTQSNLSNTNRHSMSKSSSHQQPRESTNDNNNNKNAMKKSSSNNIHNHNEQTNSSAPHQQQQRQQSSSSSRHANTSSLSDSIAPNGIAAGGGGSGSVSGVSIGGGPSSGARRAAALVKRWRARSSAASSTSTLPAVTQSQNPFSSPPPSSSAPTSTTSIPSPSPFPPPPPPVPSNQTTNAHHPPQLDESSLAFATAAAAHATDDETDTSMTTTRRRVARKSRERSRRRASTDMTSRWGQQQHQAGMEKHLNNAKGGSGGEPLAKTLDSGRFTRQKSWRGSRRVVERFRSLRHREKLKDELDEKESMQQKQQQNDDNFRNGRKSVQVNFEPQVNGERGVNGHGQPHHTAVVSDDENVHQSVNHPNYHNTGGTGADTDTEEHHRASRSSSGRTRLRRRARERRERWRMGWSSASGSGGGGSGGGGMSSGNGHRHNHNGDENSTSPLASLSTPFSRKSTGSRPRHNYFHQAKQQYRTDRSTQDSNKNGTRTATATGTGTEQLKLDDNEDKHDDQHEQHNVSSTKRRVASLRRRKPTHSHSISNSHNISINDHSSNTTNWTEEPSSSTPTPTSTQEMQSSKCSSSSLSLRDVSRWSLDARGRALALALLGNRSLARRKLGDVEGALADAARCLQLDASWMRGYVRRAAALREAGRIKEAREIAKQGLKREAHHAGLIDFLQSLEQSSGVGGTDKKENGNSESGSSGGGRGRGNGNGTGKGEKVDVVGSVTAVG